MDKLPEVGQIIKIRHSVEAAKWFSTRVEDKTAELLTIAAPLEQGTVVPYGVGSDVQVQFDQADALYSFTTTVVSRRLLGDNLRVYDLAPPREIKRQQRRQMFRLPLALPLQYEVVSLSEKRELVIPGVPLKGCIKDISGGGVKLVSDIEIPNNSVVKLKLKAEGIDLSVGGKIVNHYANEEPDQKEYGYCYGIQFIDLDRGSQDRIISFIFEEQRRRRRRELALGT